ncbi:MAG: hypothetical protein A2315_05445 [Ignavibacteria bacterium RIFOXYB2_FULL_35_12]|nr:MAG: hypothetical protein A2058_00880 [Ignavibacteria bacterium GWA2_36_19]OGU51939.1 MAG: hypothetical protein A2006_01715 [Ignavibacteria bacterium GWC2_35_8]OGU56659.1 MAG: hypothetical protein A2X60_06135 [Ignavibacteria bacterium GWF2_35_20]OGU81392.1 MAG: hypothetical protein A2254_02690 [Ignavibacteria bacterium RIFOXYA2_FULL_35_9]OGU86356.1 MAG: hypothetical protein A3K31_02050 [Ignavibacteria bacterium RIFOXYA12_FULL_35_25]OGU87798.1 MAG: hypothetical protein A2492_12555 [Ignavibac
MAALITGLLVGAFRLIIEIQSKTEAISTVIFQDFASINFLHFAIYLFILSSFVLVIVSLLTQKPAEEKLTGLIYNRYAVKEESAWRTANISFSILLVIVLIYLWFTFR